PVGPVTAHDPPAATGWSSSPARRAISAWVAAAGGRRCARNRLFRVLPRRSRGFTRAILVVVVRVSASGPSTGQVPASHRTAGGNADTGPPPQRTGTGFGTQPLRQREPSSALRSP